METILSVEYAEFDIQSLKERKGHLSWHDYSCFEVDVKLPVLNKGK